MPEAEGWIAGPEDEDPGYAEECRNLAESLGVSGRVKFLGFQKVEDLMPKIGLTILSSISEALPLVILEGYAAGVPTVSTDVGSCRQLIEGLADEDRSLGHSGAVVNIADPQALADAALGHPVALEQVDLAFLGVDPVLREDQRAPPCLVQHGAEKAGIAGRNAVVGACRNQLVGDPGQLPERRMHDAHCPEVVDERRVG